MEPRHNATTNTGKPLAALNFIAALDAMTNLANALGKNVDAARYAPARQRYMMIFNERFYDPDAHTFNQDTSDPMTVQSIGATAVLVGVVPSSEVPRVISALTASVAARGLTVGATGSQHLLAALARHGANDVASGLATTQEYPSWVYWLTQNATTCWESWSGVGDEMHPGGGVNGTGNPPTHNHIFLCGGVGEYLYRNVVGIAPAAPGYRVATISPRVPLPQGVEGARASVRTVRGTIAAEWNLLEKTGLSMSVSVPLHVEARITLPFSGRSAEEVAISVVADDTQVSVVEKGQCKSSPQSRQWGLSCEANGSFVTFGAASGHYIFEMKPLVVAHV